MRQRTLERWIAVGIVGAGTGWLTARVVVLPRVAARVATVLRNDRFIASTVPAHDLARAQSPQPSVAVEPAPLDPTDESPVAPTHARRRATALAPAPMPARLAHTARGYRLDLRGADPAVLSRGLVVVPDAVGGFRIVARDRAGFLLAAGIAPGDRIVALDGRAVLTADDALDALVRAQHARFVTLGLVRGSSRYTVPVELWRGEPD